MPVTGEPFLRSRITSTFILQLLRCRNSKPLKSKVIGRCYLKPVRRLYLRAVDRVSVRKEESWKKEYTKKVLGLGTGLLEPGEVGVRYVALHTKDSTAISDKTAPQIAILKAEWEVLMQRHILRLQRYKFD
jgi:hypothetical protein